MGEWDSDLLHYSNGGWIDLQHKCQAVNEVVGVKEIIQ